MNRKMRILLGGMFLCLGLPFAAPAQDAAPFRVATVADGLEHPWSLAFLPDGHAPAQVLDNLLRFTSGIYFGMGFLLAWVIATIGQHHTLLYFLGFIVAMAGLGRAWSIAKVGCPSAYIRSMMWLEILLGAAIIALQYLRS